MSIKNFFVALINLFRKPSVQAAFDRAEHIAMDVALPIAKTIAALTPTRADDEIIAAFEHFAVPLDKALLAVPVDKRGMVLFDLGTNAVLNLLPVGTARSIAGLAVQAAVTALKAS